MRVAQSNKKCCKVNGDFGPVEVCGGAGQRRVARRPRYDWVGIKDGR